MHKNVSNLDNFSKYVFLNNIFILHSAQDRISSDTTHNSIQWIYHTVKIDTQSKTKIQLSIYFLSPTKIGVVTTNVYEEI